MHTNKLYVVGAGGHAKVVLDALGQIGEPSGCVVVRDDRTVTGNNLLGYPVEYPAISDKVRLGSVHVAIGCCLTRRKLCNEAKSLGANLFSVHHPKADISSLSVIQDGCFIASLSIVAAHAEIAEGTIVNHGAVVDHDCRIGRYCHVAPNATLCGGVVVGDGVLIGAGATVLPGVSIGEGAKIGAGVVLKENVEAGSVVRG